MRRFFIVLLFAARGASAAITGIVVDDQGQPIAGATLHAYAAESSSAQRVRLIKADFARQPLATATSRPDGRFSLDAKSLPVDLVAEALGRETALIETNDGEDVGAIVLGRADRRIKIRAEGKPVPNAAVIFSSAVVLRTDAQGEVPDTRPGWPKLVISSDYAPQIVGGGEVILSRGMALRGRVVNATGPVAHAMVLLDAIPLVETADDGSFTIAHAPTSWQQLAAASSAEIGATAHAAGNVVEIRVGPAMMASGNARDSVSGAPIAGARLYLGESGEMTLSDANGHYAFGPVPRELLTVSGRHPRYTIQEAAAGHNVNLAARPVARLEGRVVDERGAPVSAATVFAPGPPAKRAVTTSDGRFTIRSPDRSRATSLYAQKQGFAVGFAPPRVWHDGDEIHDLVITLPRGFPLQVRVVDERRRPVAGAHVIVRRTDIEMFRYSVGSDEPGCSTCRSADAGGILNYRITEGEYRFAVYDGEGNRAPKIVGPVALDARSSPFTIELSEPAAAAPAKGTPIAGGAIVGRVVDRITRRAIPDFEVALESGPMLMLRQLFETTDGSFKLDDISPGEITVRVFAPGYVSSSADVVVDEKRPASNVEIELAQGGRIGGRVTSKQLPVSLATVRLVEDRADISVESVPTDDDGRFVLDGVPPGEWTIEFWKEGFVAARRRVALKGAEARLDVDLDRGIELRGRVVDPRGSGVSGAEVLAISPGQQSPFSSGRSGVGGWFSIGGLLPSHYTITARKEGVITAAVERDLPAAEPLVITVETGLSLTGRVSGISPSDLPALRITISANETYADATIDSAGGFVIHGVPEGRVLLTAVLQREGAERRVTKEINVRSGMPPVEIDLAEGFVIRGRVTRNGVPLRYASINFNDDANGAVNAFGVVRDGLYEVALPKPATYVVSIMTDFNFRYSVRMSLSASGTRDIDIHGSDLRGRVVDAQSGAPAAGAEVTFIGNGAPSSVRTAAANAAGRFILTDVTDDAGTLSVRLDPYALANRTIKMAVDAGQDIEVRMERGGDVRFLIVDSVDGTPVPSASVNVGEMPSMTVVRLDSNGIGSAALTPGRQKAQIWAKGYLSQTLEITVPVSEVRVPLVKGGVLHVDSKQPRWLRLTIRGTSNTVWYGMTGRDDVVPPGDYALEVLTREQRLEKSVPVTIRAGERLTVPLD